MYPRNSKRKKTLSKTVKMSDHDWEEIRLALDISDEELSPFIREATLAAARSITREARERQQNHPKAYFGVVDPDGEIKYCFG